MRVRNRLTRIYLILVFTDETYDITLKDRDSIINVIRRFRINNFGIHYEIYNITHFDAYVTVWK